VKVASPNYTSCVLSVCLAPPVFQTHPTAPPHSDSKTIDPPGRLSSCKAEPVQMSHLSRRHVCTERFAPTLRVPSVHATDLATRFEAGPMRPPCRALLACGWIEYLSTATNDVVVAGGHWIDGESLQSGYQYWRRCPHAVQRCGGDHWEATAWGRRCASAETRVSGCGFCPCCYCSGQ